MSLRHRLPDSVVRGVPQTSIFQECSQQTRIALATPDQEKQETRACEGVCGPQETIDEGRQRIEETTLQPSVRDVMLAAVPSLRAFAISLGGNGRPRRVRRWHDRLDGRQLTHSLPLARSRGRPWRQER